MHRQTAVLGQRDSSQLCWMLFAVLMNFRKVSLTTIEPPLLQFTVIDSLGGGEVSSPAGETPCSALGFYN